MILRFTNTALLAIILILSLTGGYGIVWTLNGWVMEVHRAAGWALIALIPWKIGISWRSLRRGLGKRFDRGPMIGISLLLAVITLVSLGFSLMWAWRIGPEELWFRQTTVAWHWILALALLAPLVLHIWRRWPKPKTIDFVSRRGALRLLGLAAAGVIGWQAAEALSQARALEEHPRRVTGSRRHGKFTGNDFPLTGERAPEIDLKSWRLVVSGAVAQPLQLSHDDLIKRPPYEWVATLDCTLGWYTTQIWQGVRLADLLTEAQLRPVALGVLLRSVTGYSHVFTLAEARQILIATHIGGEPLQQWHGYPARAVAPFRRGWFWVKWLGEISVLAGPE